MQLEAFVMCAVRTRLGRGIVDLVFGLSLILALPAYGQAPPAQAPQAPVPQAPALQRLERVEITGSSIKRIEAEEALPVLVLTREDIDATGATSVVELMQRLPLVQRSTNEALSVGSGGSGFAGVSLHGLGETRTLVLLNGRRIASFGGQALTGRQAGVNLQTLPLAAVERVEILADGASAIYGADAIGGVVNFILKRNFSSGEVIVGGASPTAGGGSEWGLSVAKGWGDLDKDGYNLMIAASQDQRKPIAASQRSFARSTIIDFGHNGTPYRFSSRSSTAAIPANIILGGVPTNPYLAVNGVCPPGHIRVGPMCNYDYLQQFEIQPEVERRSLMASFSKRIGTDQRFFVDLIAADASTITRVAPTAGLIVIPTTSPFYGVPASLGATTDVPAVWRVGDLGSRVTDDRSKAHHLVAGFDGFLAGWDYTASYTRSVSTYSSYLKDGWATTSGINAALNSGLVNPFIEQGLQTPAGLQALRAARALGYYDGGRSTLDFAEVRGSRTLFNLPHGPLLLGAGISFQNEQYQTNPSGLAQGIGDTRYGDSAALVPYSASRHSWAGFVELVAPITDTFELTGALRHDVYSDFGDTTNYKLGARWQPARSLLLRASVGSGFRAPTVPQIAAGRQENGLTQGMYACPFAPGDLPAGVVCPAGTSQYNVFAEGNPNLRPETSRHYSVGVRWEPLPIMTLGMDFWSVKLDDTIGQVNEATIFGDPQTFRSAFTTFVHPVTGLVTLAMNQGNVNLGRSDNKGIDFDATLRWRAASGTFTSQLLATYMIRRSYQRLPGGPYFSDVGVYNDGGVTFRWQGRVANTFAHGDWTHVLMLNFKSGYSETQAVTNLVTSAAETITRDVAPYFTWDWQTRFKLSRSLDLSVGILNLTDRAPPLSLKAAAGGQQVGYDDRYADARGRTLYGNLKLRF